MWALVSHLKDEKTRDYTANVLKYCLAAIREWWDAIHYDSPKIVSFRPPPPYVTQKRIDEVILNNDYHSSYKPPSPMLIDILFACLL